MAGTAERRALASTICELLQEGITLTTGDVAFVESAWGIDARAELATLMHRPEDWDAESLVIMVFSADALSCQRLLPAIQSAAYTETDVDKIVSFLVKSPPTVPLSLPDGMVVTTMAAPPAGIQRYVESLRITQRLPPTAEKHLREALSANERIDAALSHLRISRIPWDDDAAAMLLRLCERLGRAKDFMALLTVLTAVLETVTGAADVAEALAHRKRTYFRALNAADRFQSSAGRHNMETLMMMGIRPPVISAEAARLEMNLTDRIAMALFERTEVIMPEAMTVSNAAMDGASPAPLTIAGEDEDSA